MAYCRRSIIHDATEEGQATANTVGPLLSCYQVLYLQLEYKNTLRSCAQSTELSMNFFVAIKIITNMVVFLIFLLRSRFSYLLLQRPLQLTSGNQKGQREAPPIPRNTPRGQPRACSLYMGPIHRGNKQNRPSRLYCPPRRRGPVSRGGARCSSAVGMFL